MNIWESAEYTSSDSIFFHMPNTKNPSQKNQSNAVRKKNSKPIEIDAREIVWKGLSSSETKAQKEFNAALNKHKATLEMVHQFEKIFQIVNKTYTEELIPDMEKMKALEKKKFEMMCDVLIEERVSFGKMQREFLRRYLLQICNDTYYEDPKFYGKFREHLETKFERLERERYKNQVEAKIKAQFGVEIDMDELNQTYFETDEERETHEQKFREFREKYDEYREKFYEGRSDRSSRSKGKEKVSEKVKKTLEAERLLSLDINSLFKNLAKLIHPDKEQNPKLREQKSQLMRELSGARDTMNIAEILEIKMKVDSLIPENQTDVSFDDSSIKRFIKIIKSKIKELEQSISTRFLSHPVMAEFPGIKISKESVEKYLKSVKNSNQKNVSELEKQLELFSKEPKYIKELIKELQGLGAEF